MVMGKGRVNESSSYSLAPIKMNDKKYRMNKKGQQMTLGTIIAIVLGIVVLVLLIFGFQKGWKNLWSEITEIGGGKANVDTIKRACTLACSTQSVDAYCNQQRIVKFGDDRADLPGTCQGLDSIGVDGCPAITCPEKGAVDENGNPVTGPPIA